MSRIVAVRRSGGFAGMVRSGEVDLDSDDERAAELEGLLPQVSPPADPGPGRPDGFSYEFDLCGTSCAVPEHALTPDLRRIADLVLD